jgi:hypothetical protein
MLHICGGVGLPPHGGNPTMCETAVLRSIPKEAFADFPEAL